MIRQDMIICPHCKRTITREEMDEELRTGKKTLFILDGRLCHKVCLPVRVSAE